MQVESPKKQKPIRAISVSRENFRYCVIFSLCLCVFCDFFVCFFMCLFLCVFLYVFLYVCFCVFLCVFVCFVCDIVCKLCLCFVEYQSEGDVIFESYIDWSSSFARMCDLCVFNNRLSFCFIHFSDFFKKRTIALCCVRSQIPIWSRRLVTTIGNFRQIGTGMNMQWVCDFMGFFFFWLFFEFFLFVFFFCLIFFIYFFVLLRYFCNFPWPIPRVNWTQ